MTSDREEDAAALERVVPILYRQADRLMREERRGDASATDLVQSVIRSYLSNVRKGKITVVNSLQSLLLTILKRKVWKRRNRWQRQYDQQRLSQTSDQSASSAALDSMNPDSHLPDEGSRVHDLLRLLPTDVHRAVAVLRADGYTQEEIAQQLEMSSRTVRNKLGEIRMQWESYGRD